MGKVTVGKPAAVGGVAKEEKEEKVRQPQHGAVVVDATGRRIMLRELDFLEESRLVRMLGSDASFNGHYMRGYVIPAACVAKIDEEEYGVPSTSKEIDAAIKRLGRHGFAAIAPVLYPDIAGEEDEDVKN